MFHLFYPPEMKSIVDELRANDDLNTHALTTFNAQIFVCLLCVFFLTILFLADGLHWLAFISIFLGIILTKYTMNKTFKASFLPYLMHDEVLTGLVLKIGSKLYRTLVVDCKLSNGETRHFSIYCYAFPQGEELKPGMRFKFFLDPTNKDVIIPNIYELNFRGCLSKRILEENRKYTIDSIIKENNRIKNDSGSET